MKTRNVLIAGVGGQGILLVGKILGSYANRMEMDVKVSEVHGMAQRGGSVVTHVRMGSIVHSPLVGEGEADAILSFEPVEALRYADLLKEHGCIVCAKDRVLPVAVALGEGVYPVDAEQRLMKLTPNLLLIDGAALAREAGGLMTLNIVLLGAFTAQMGLDRESMERAMEENIKERFVAMNRIAFGLGYGIVKGAES